MTGCFDWFHSGHVRFFEEASALGELYVVVGHDANVRLLKGEGHPLFPQEERRYLVAAVRYVHRALISSGEGWLDAEPEIRDPAAGPLRGQRGRRQAGEARVLRGPRHSVRGAAAQCPGKDCPAGRAPTCGAFEKDSMQHAVILAGGSGTRLWPLSRRARPKQLLPLAGGPSLLERAWRRLDGLVEPSRRWVCAGEGEREVIRRTLGLPPERFIGEPCGRDTLERPGPERRRDQPARTRRRCWRCSPRTT